MKSLRTYGALGTVGVGVTAALALLAANVPASADDSFAGWGQPPANPRTAVQDNALASNLDETAVAWGQLPLTNPDTAFGVTHYGYNTSNGGPLTQDPKEAFKTEPDKNVYLVLNGHHYLYQGHEGGPAGYVTRVDLDQADPAKRVTLIADKDPAGARLPDFDGITWDPFTHQLFLTAESKAPVGGVFAVSLDADGNATSPLARLTTLGSGGYEGIQNDSDGNVWMVEDIGGAGRDRRKRQGAQQLRLPVQARRTRATSRRAAPCRPCRSSGPTALLPRPPSSRPTPTTPSSAGSTPTAAASGPAG